MGRKLVEVGRESVYEGLIWGYYPIADRHQSLQSLPPLQEFIFYPNTPSVKV